MPSRPTNNVFDREAQKGLAANSQPLIFVTSFNYRTPRREGVVGAILGDWTFAGLLRYASGSLIGTPGAQNQLGSLLFQNTRMNRVEGQPLFLKDPNCGCIDPRKDFVLNPAAWSDPAPGQFGTSAAYHDDYRWQTQVQENMSVGRRFSAVGTSAFEIRAEFFNVFNRRYLVNPTSGNPFATRTFNALGEPTGGFGYVTRPRRRRSCRAADRLSRGLNSDFRTAARVALQQPTRPESECRETLESVAIVDQKPGIAEEVQSRAFERFYRVDAARTRDGVSDGGAGPGLALARWIAHV